MKLNNLMTKLGLKFRYANLHVLSFDKISVRLIAKKIKFLIAFQEIVLT